MQISINKLYNFLNYWAINYRKNTIGYRVGHCNNKVILNCFNNYQEETIKGNLDFFNFNDFNNMFKETFFPMIENEKMKLKLLKKFELEFNQYLRKQKLELI